MNIYAEIASNKRKSIFLILIFFASIVAIGYFLSVYYEGGAGITAIAVVIATVMSLVSYYQGDKIALAVAGARPVSSTDNPYVYRLVENLCITAGIPMPKVYLIPDPALNAFATGRDPKHASIALTTGIVEALENEELEGVIAHELSHVKNYDIRLATVVIICVGIVALIADITTRSLFWGRGRRGSGGRGNATAILALIGIILAIFAPIFARLIQFAVSRKREFLADASGALLTRYPEGLARALEKIAANATPLQRVNHATAHLYLANPFGSRAVRGLGKLFSTHPPIEERVRRLRQH